MAPLTEVAVVNSYTLRLAPADFVAAATTLAARVETDGHPGLLSYRFYCPTGGSDARLMALYTSPEAWVGHHDIVMGWPEMAALRATCDLTEIALHGPISPAMQDWIDRAGLTVQLRHLGQSVAGFRRDPQ